MEVLYLRRLLQKHASENVRLPDLFDFSKDVLNLTDEMFDFFENHLTETIRNIGVENSGDAAVIHCVMDRAVLEDETGSTVDDATCKIITKCFSNDAFMKTMTEKVEELAVKNGVNLSVHSLEFEYGDGVFHVIGTLYRG
jgi:hypothetical protein